MIIARKTTQPQYEEKLYSTGDDYLDELLERAFCEGYEYAQKEFGNPLNKAAKRAYEVSMAKGGLKSLGFDSNNKKDVENMMNVNRIRNRAQATGASMDGITGIINSLGVKSRNTRPTLDQRITAKGAMDRNNKLGQGWNRIQKAKEVMAQRDYTPARKWGNHTWEGISGGGRGASNQKLWDMTR